MKESGCEKYSKWFETIDKACNTDNYMGIDDLNGIHYKLDNDLHVYKAVYDEINTITISNGEIANSLEFMGATQDKNLVYNKIDLYGFKDKSPKSDYTGKIVYNRRYREYCSFPADIFGEQGYREDQFIDDDMETILDKAISMAKDDETKNNISRLKGFYEKVHQFIEKENLKEKTELDSSDSKDNKENNNEIQATLKKDEYFNYGEKYFVTFKYDSDKQKRLLYEVFQKELIPSYGSNSSRALDGKEYIMPYLIDKEGNMTPENTGVIGGTSIPKDLLSDFIKRFVEVDGMNIGIGDKNIKEKFDESKFNDMITELDKNEDEIDEIFTEDEISELDQSNVDRENDDKIFSRTSDFTPDELEQMSTEDLEGMLRTTEEKNEAKRKSLEELKKKELISQIRAAVAEGKELDAKIAKAKDITKEK